LFPALLSGLRLWASVCLALYVAFWLELDNAFWAGTSAAIVCQPHLGASLRKGWFRLIGIVIGAIAIVVLTAGFPQDCAPFLVGLALWGAGCALVETHGGRHRGRLGNARQSRHRRDPNRAPSRRLPGDALSIHSRRTNREYRECYGLQLNHADRLGVYVGAEID
jgi:hypothetical protein